jgi:hypothetical protein
VLPWELLFLLNPVAQALVIEKVAGALNPGGRFLFTALKESLEWLDAMTGRQSQSLGAQTYGAITARCRSDLGGRSAGRKREPLLLRREAAAEQPPGGTTAIANAQLTRPFALRPNDWCSWG